ncbi:acyltransferase family protein [Dokdonella soli]|uniref:acyltransferase family protein n=1 Tax=Dokdonella soli TaxID=529810 RepID=UPI00360B224D
MDGLRAGSIALVLLGHLQGARGFPPVELWRSLGDLANLGVNIFFIISGFLITSLLMSERQRTGGVSLKAFYVRRVLRIFPAFYAFILIIVIADLIGWVRISMTDLVTALTYVVNYNAGRSWNIGHLWSLSVEEQFYLLWPLLFIRLGGRRAVIAAFIAFAAAPVIRAGMHLALASGPYRDLEIFPAVADGIAIGCAIALLRPWLLTQPAYVRLTGSRWLLLLLPLIVMVNRERGYTLVDLLVWPWMLLLMAVLVEASTRRTATWTGRLLNLRPVVFIGTLSYSLYLWQQPFLNRHADAPVTAFPLNLALAFAAALLSYFIIERPFLRLRRHALRASAVPRAEA